jgi:peptidyl-prolyl cis-trans isomerase SurA
VSADTWALVNGREITRDEVEKAYRRARGAGQTLSDHEALTAKLGLLDDLILQELLLAKTGELKLEVTSAELDTAYTDARRNIPDEAFQQELTRRELTPDDVREGLRRQLLTQKVIAQAVGSNVAIADQEISGYFVANREQFNVPEEAYHIAQIVVTPTPEAPVPNATGDDATTPQAAAAKVTALMERLKAGTSFQELAAGYSEDPESAPRGGDLGLVPVSRLRQAPAALRNAVLNKEPGSVSVVSAGGAHTIVLVVAHEQAGQRDLTTPGLRERITETLREQKTELLRTAYLTTLRSDADVTNYLARRLVESKGEMPSLQMAVPGQK